MEFTETFGGAGHYDDKDGLGQYIGDPCYRPAPVPTPSALRHSGQSSPDLGRPARDLYSSDESGAGSPVTSREIRSRSEGERSPERPRGSDSHSQGLERERPHRTSEVPARSDAAQGPTAGTTQSRAKGAPTQKTPGNPPEKEAMVHSEASTRPTNKNQSASSSMDVHPKKPVSVVAAAVVSQSELKTHSNSSRLGRPATGRNHNRMAALGLNLEVSGESESQRLHDALERARVPDSDPAPKARSFDTVLCLDTSASMWDGGAFDHMIRVANQFIDGVEDVVNDSGVEENMALVTFGGIANIVQHLTNDFTRVRDAIERIEVGGKSPFFEAMVVCLAAFDGKGGIVSIGGEYDVRPRIIFITDGHITECSDDPYGLDKVSDATNTRAGFSRLMMDLCPKPKYSVPHPIIFVPVGSCADRTFLQSMARLNESLLIEPENLTSQCTYFRMQETVGKVIKCMHTKELVASSEDQIDAVVRALVPDISKQEATEVIKKVKEELENPSRKRGRGNKHMDFDYVFEDKDGVMSGDRLPLGRRVLRGPDWKWSDQDGRGAGTVLQHEEDRHPFTWVMWDTGGWNRYPYGPDLGYGIFSTDDYPLLKPQDGQLQIGMTVVRGPKWNHADSKHDKDPGVVIRKSKDGKQLKVRWQNGEIQVCPTDAVQFSDPFESDPKEGRRQLTLGEELFGHQLDQVEEEEVDGERVRVWQWKDDWGNWHLYTQQQTDSLERAYKRKRNGTCIIQRKSKNFRVMFGRMKEKDIDVGMEKDVRRVLIPWEEHQSLVVAEELVSSS